MKFKRLLYSLTGRIVISVLLGLGIATLFRTVCDGPECTSFVSAPMELITDKQFKFDGKCYKYKPSATSCKADKKIVEIGEGEDLEKEEEKGPMASLFNIFGSSS